ncbi:MAG: hypothetical protein Q8O92_01055 [Candidatus Latescibacter sp.]|nr:hypothetical protein [Candidatus Latescibacter sp.]
MKKEFRSQNPESRRRAFTLGFGLWALDFVPSSFILLFLALFSPSVSGDTSHSVTPLIPSEKDIPGFSITRAPVYYGPQNLWNYIDGGAPPYLDYGFWDMATFTVKHIPDSLSIVVDIYDMTDSLGAFGIYANEHDTEARFLNIGVEGYVTSNALFFWKDRFYVKIMPSAESACSSSTLEQMARAVEKRIPGGNVFPRFFSFFPVEGKLARSEKYIAKDVLGQDFLRKAFTVEYEQGDKRFRLYLIESSGPEQAKENFRSCMEYIRNSGGIDKGNPTLGDEAFTGKESFYGTVMFARKGKYILASVGLADLKLAERHLLFIMKNL